MSVASPELSELTLDESPPCELIDVLQNTLCGRPSVIRVVLMCSYCGLRLRVFLCKGCWEQVKGGDTECRRCGEIDAYEITCSLVFPFPAT
jgi:predicted amidophosphoribosyltransferase